MTTWNGSDGWAIVWKTPQLVPFTYAALPKVPCSGAFHVFESRTAAEKALEELDLDSQLNCHVARVRCFVDTADPSK